MSNAKILARHFVDLCVGYSTSDAINALGLAMVGVIHAEALNSANGCALVDDMAASMKEWLRREGGAMSHASFVWFFDDDENDDEYDDDLEYDEFRPDLIDDADGDEEGGVAVFDPGDESGCRYACKSLAA